VRGSQRGALPLRVSPYPHCVRPLLHRDVSLKGFPLVTNAAGACAAHRCANQTERTDAGGRDALERLRKDR
jgi:hypothetical protein